MHQQAKNPSSTARRVAGRDYEGIIIDLLDDIVSAENRGKLLVDRLDSISKRPSLRVINMDMYLWTVAGTSLAGCITGIVIGFLIWH